MYFILNIYSGDQQNTLKYLKNTEVNLNNVLIMTGDFNIRDSDWNPSYPCYLTYSDTLRKVADSLNLELSTLINPVPTWYVDNPQDSNSVINLIFLHAEFNNHQISPKLQSPSDHAPLLVSIIIEEKIVQGRKKTIVKNNEEEEEFVNEFRIKISDINMTNILDNNILEHITQ